MLELKEVKRKNKNKQATIRGTDRHGKNRKKRRKQENNATCWKIRKKKRKKEKNKQETRIDQLQKQ